MTRPQEIRHEILLQLYASGRIPVSVAHIRKTAERTAKFRDGLSEDDIRDQLHFLMGQEFAKEVASEGTGAIRYVITSKGMLEHERNDG